MKRILTAILVALCSAFAAMGFASCDIISSWQPDSGLLGEYGEYEITLDTSNFDPIVAHNQPFPYDDLTIVYTSKTASGAFYETKFTAKADMVVSGLDMNTTGEKKLVLEYRGERFTVPYTVKYKVQFVTKAETFTQFVYQSSEVEIPDVPESEGYTFAYWSSEIPETLTENVTVEAHYYNDALEAPALQPIDCVYEPTATLADIEGLLASNENGKWEFIDDTLSVGTVGTYTYGVRFVPATDEIAPVADATAEVRVAKKQLEFTVETGSYVYNREAQFPAYTFPVEVEVVESIPRPTDAGTYEYTLTVADANYAGSYEGEFTIEPKEVQFIVGETSFVYDGKTQFYPTYTFSDEGDEPNVLRISGKEEMNAGSYTYGWLVVDDNYTGMATGKYTVEKPNVTVTAQGYEITYPEKVPTVAYTVEGFEDAELLDVTISTPSPASAGSYTLTPVVGNSNVNATCVSATLVIHKGTPEFYAPTLSTETAPAVYDDPVSTVTFSNEGWGSWAWKYPDARINSMDGISAVAVFTPQDPNLETLEHTFTIDKVDKRRVDVVITRDAYTYTGEEFTLEYKFVDRTEPDGYTVDEDKLTITGNTPEVNVGSYNKTLVIVSDCYSGSVSAGLHIDKATPVVTLTPAGSSVAYTYGLTLERSGIELVGTAVRSGDGAAVSGSFAWVNSAFRLDGLEIGAATPVEVCFTPTGEDENNYNPVVLTYTVTVVKAATTIQKWEGTDNKTDLQDYKKVYDGKAFDFVATVNHGEEPEILCQYKNTATNEITSSITEAGEYELTVTVGATEHYLDATKTVHVSITQATNGWTDGPAVRPRTSWSYLGTASSVIASAKFGTGTVVITYTNESTGTVYENTLPKDAQAGAYTALVVLPETANWTGLEETLTFTIDKAEVRRPDVGFTSNPYTGSPQKPTINGTYADGTVNDGYGNEVAYTVKYSNPDSVNVGSYTVIVTLKDENNYVWAGTKSNVFEYTYTITQATNSITGLTIEGWKYLEWSEVNLPTATATFGTPDFTYYTTQADALGGENAVTLDFIKTAPAKKYYVRADVAATENYAAASTWISFAISDADLENVDFNKTYTVIWNASLTLRNITLPEGYRWDNPDTPLEVNETGSKYPATFTKTNYNPVQGVFKVIVKKATPKIEGLKDTYTKEYDGNAFTLPESVTHTNTDANVALTYEQYTNAGTYTVTVTLAGTAHYEKASATFTLVIERKVNTQTIPAMTVTYEQTTMEAIDGSGKTLADYNDEYGSWSWVRGNDTAVDGVGTHSYEAKYTPKPEYSANYAETTVSVSVTVNQATPEISGLEESYTKVYDGMAFVLTGVTHTNTDEGATLTYTTQCTNAGEYTLTITVAETTNFKAVEVTRPLTITQATPTIEGLKDSYEMDYNGGAFVLTGVTGTNPETDVEYDQVIEGGTHEIEVWTKETGNYIRVKLTTKVTIKAIDNGWVEGYKPTMSAWTYGDAAPVLDIEALKAQLKSQNKGFNAGLTPVVTYTHEGGTVYTNTIPTDAPAGVYTVAIKVAGNNNWNKFEAATFNVTMAKKPIDVPTLTVNGEAYTEEFSYDGGVKASTLAASDYYSFENVSGTNAGTYTVTLKLNENYKWSDGTTADKTLSFVIAQATWTGETVYDYTTELEWSNGLTPATSGIDLTGTGFAWADSVLDEAWVPDDDSKQEFAAVYTDVSGNYAPIAATIKVKINRMKVQLTETQIKTDLVYDGSIEYAVSDVVSVTSDRTEFDVSKCTITWTYGNGNEITYPEKIVDAGDYTLAISWSEEVSKYYNITVDSTPVTVTIDRATPTANVNGTSGVPVTAPEGWEWIDNVPQYDEKGTHEVTAKYTTLDPNYTETGIVYIHIDKDAVSPEIKASSDTYTGKELVITITVGALIPGTNENAQYTVACGEYAVAYSGSTATITVVNAGTYTITLTLTTRGSEGYSWAGTTELSIVKTVTIKRATPDVTIETKYTATWEEGLTLGDIKPKGSVNTGSYTWVDADGNAVSTATKLDADTYNSWSILYTPEGTANYATVREKATITVSPKPITAEDIAAVTDVDGKSYDYSGTQYITLTDGVGYTVAITGTSFVEDKEITYIGIDAGNYTITLTAKENYAFADGVATNYSFIINQAVVEATLTGEQLVYNGEAQEQKFTVGDLTAGRDYTYSGHTNTNADNYAITITITNPNYKFKDGAITYLSYSINQAENAWKSDNVKPKFVNADNVTVKGWTFDEDTPTLSWSVNNLKFTTVLEGSIKSSVKYVNTVTNAESSSVPTAAGSYKVVITVEGDTNWETFKDESLTFEIAPKPVGISISGAQNLTYDTVAHVITIFGEACDVAFTGDSDEDGKYSVTNAGRYTVTLTLQDSANYTWHDDETLNKILGEGNWSVAGDVLTYTFTVAHKTTSALPEAVIDFTYGDKTVAFENGEGYTVAITKDGKSVTSVKDVGTYVVTLTLSDSNYTWPTKIPEGWISKTDDNTLSCAFTIGQRTLTAGFADESELTYNGEDQTKEVSVGNWATGDTQVYTVIMKKGDATVTEAIDAGTYTITVAITNENYTLVYANGAEMLEFTIKPAVVTAVIVGESSFVYKNEEIRPTVKVTATINGTEVTLPESDYEVSGYQTVVGKYELQVKLKDTVKNYTFNTENLVKLAYEITLSTNYTATVTVLEPVYWKEDQKLSDVITASAGIDGKFTYTDEILDYIGEKEFTFTFTPTDTNYAAKDDIEVTINVIKVKVTLTGTDQTITTTYSGNEYTIPVGTIKATPAVELIYTPDRTMKDAGTYTVTITLAENYQAHYTLGESAVLVTVTIDKANNEVYLLTYNKNEGEFEFDAKYDPEDATKITYKYREHDADDTVEWSVWSDTTRPTKSGSYDVRVTIAETENYNEVTSNPFTINFEFDYQYVTHPSIKDDDIAKLTYNGSEQTVTIPAFDNTTIKITDEEGNELTEGVKIDGNNVFVTDVGDYYVVYELPDGFIWTETSEKYSNPILIATVEKGSVAWLEEPSIADATGTDDDRTFTYNYDGTVHTASATAYLVGVEDKDITFDAVVKYYSDYECKNEVTASASVNAGTYYVKFTVADTNNYVGITETVMLEINQAEVELTPTGISGTYYQNLLEFNKDNDGVVTDIEYKGEMVFKADDYEATAHGALVEGVFTIHNDLTFVSQGNKNESTVSYFTVSFAPADTANYIGIKNQTVTVTLKAVAYIGSTDYGTIENALRVNSGDVYVIPNTTGDVIIKESVTSNANLYLPYSGSTWKSRGNGVNSATFADLNGSTKRTSWVKIADGVTLTLNGTLGIGGQIGSNINQVPSGNTYGNYAELLMMGGAKLISNGKVDCYGYIKEADKDGNYVTDGDSQTIFNGEVWMPFVVYDFKGGGHTSAYSSSGNGKTQDVSPFYVYDMPNIQSEMVFNYGSKLWGYAELYASNSTHTGEVQLLGTKAASTSNLAVIYLTESDAQAIFKYTPEIAGRTTLNGTVTITMVGGAELAPMSMSLAIADVDMKSVLFPISWKYDITVKDGEYTISTPIKLLSGSAFTVEENATLNITNSFIVYPESDVNPIKKTSPYYLRTEDVTILGIKVSTKDVYDQEAINATSLNNGVYDSWSLVLDYPGGLSAAQLLVKGTLNISDTAVKASNDFGGFGGVVTVGSAKARLNVTSSASNLTVTSQEYVQAGQWADIYLMDSITKSFEAPGNDTTYMSAGTYYGYTTDGKTFTWVPKDTAFSVKYSYVLNGTSNEFDPDNNVSYAIPDLVYGGTVTLGFATYSSKTADGGYFIFKGWYDNASGEGDPIQTITWEEFAYGGEYYGKTIYGVFEYSKNAYTANFTDESGVLANATMAFGSLEGLDVMDNTAYMYKTQYNENYEYSKYLVGWSLTEGATEASSQADINAALQTAFENETFITLYAVWANKYVVKFDVGDQGLNADDDNVVYLLEDQIATFSADLYEYTDGMYAYDEVLEKSKYFNGWYINDDVSNIISTEKPLTASSFDVNKAVRLTANWSDKAAFVFNVNNTDTGAGALPEIWTDSAKTLYLTPTQIEDGYPLTNYVSSDITKYDMDISVKYEFGGWTTDQEGKKDFDSLPNFEAVPATGYQLYAQWIVKHTIVLNANTNALTDAVEKFKTAVKKWDGTAIYMNEGLLSMFDATNPYIDSISTFAEDTTVNYYFAKWGTAEGGDISFNSVEGTTDIYAQWLDKYWINIVIKKPETIDMFKDMSDTTEYLNDSQFGIFKTTYKSGYLNSIMGIDSYDVDKPYYFNGWLDENGEAITDDAVNALEKGVTFVMKVNWAKKGYLLVQAEGYKSEGGGFFGIGATYTYATVGVKIENKIDDSWTSNQSTWSRGELIYEDYWVHPEQTVTLTYGPGTGDWIENKGNYQNGKLIGDAIYKVSL